MRQAVARVVTPGAVVVDLGAGSGILGLLACQAGALRVYAIESQPTIAFARALFQANGFTDRVTFVRGWSTDVELPERADVVLCDQVGFFGYQAGLLEVCADARRRFLKPGGTMLPDRVVLHVAPVECPALRESLDFWARPLDGVDLHPGRALAANDLHAYRLSPGELLAPPVPAVSLDLANDVPEAFKFEVQVTIERAGRLDGIGGFFDATLAPGISMSTSPLAQRRINRKNSVFPLEDPVDVRPGDRIDIRMHVIARQRLASWRVSLFRSGADEAEVVRAHSTLAGMLLVPEDLARGRPDHVPVLSPRGQARRTLLELVDGRRTVSELESELARRHPSVFRSPGALSAFVARMLASVAQ